MKYAVLPAEVWTREKNFKRGSVLRSATLNLLGLHVFRILAARKARRKRFDQLKTKYPGRPVELYREIEKDGLVVVPDFLPKEAFDFVRNACLKVCSESHPNGVTKDGGTAVNRYGFAGLPETERKRVFDTFREAGLLDIWAVVSTFDNGKIGLSIEEIVHDKFSKAADGNKNWHKDTFHATNKMWFFLQDVTPEMGPLTLIPGSHKPSLRRLMWEYYMANRAVNLRYDKVTGSFRPSEKALRFMGLQPEVALTVSANTLVIANTDCFHRRGDAEAGAVRRAVWASRRPNPFETDPTKIEVGS